MSLNRINNNNSLAMTLLKGRTLIVLAVLVVFFSLATPNFLTANTMLLLAKHVALYGILAIGMTYVIITGGIDLSVGAVVGLAGMIAGGMIQNGVTLQTFGVTLYFDVPLVVAITVLAGALIGLLNGCTSRAASPCSTRAVRRIRASSARQRSATRASTSSAAASRACPSVR